MGLVLEIDFSEIGQIANDISAIRVRAEDLREAAPGFRLILQADVDQRFANAPRTTEGGNVYGGAYWRELSEAYLANTPRRVDGQIYRDTGELLQSLTISGSPYHVYEVSPTEFLFGTALIKASYLNEMRNYLFWHYELLNKCAQFLIDYISEGG